MLCIVLCIIGFPSCGDALLSSENYSAVYFAGPGGTLTSENYSMIVYMGDHAPVSVTLRLVARNETEYVYLNRIKRRYSDMETAIILMYLGTAGFFVVLGLKLPYKFGPLKFAYIAMGFYFVLAMFLSAPVMSDYAYEEYTIAKNITHEGVLYPNTNVTVTRVPYSDAMSSMNMTYWYGIAIVLCVTLAYFLIITVKERLQGMGDLADRMS